MASLDDVIGAAHHAFLAEQGKTERPAPALAAVIREIKARGAPLVILHVDSQREVRMSEIDRFAERGGAFFRDARGHGRVTHASRARQRPGRLWLLDRPGGSAILAAGQQEILGPVGIDVIIRAVVLVVSPAEADQDLVTPRPDAVVGRPAREPARLGIDLDLLQDTGRFTGRVNHAHQGRCPQCNPEPIKSPCPQLPHHSRVSSGSRRFFSTFPNRTATSDDFRCLER